MRQKFQAPVSREVVLVHGAKGAEEEIRLRVHPHPPGYVAAVVGYMPDPIEYVNGAPKGVDAARAPRRAHLRNVVLIAKALGDEVEARPPTTSDEAAWVSYAERVEAEFIAAGLTGGDLDTLVREIERVNRGAGDLGNGGSGGSGGA